MNLVLTKCTKLTFDVEDFEHISQFFTLYIGDFVYYSELNVTIS